MPDREKVIKGLMELHGSKETMDIIRDTIALLREQEPRVLTLEEAKTYEVVWPEDKGESELHPLIVQNNMNDSKYYKYGVHWRVWSAKPTDEQREAVKWE